MRKSIKWPFTLSAHNANASANRSHCAPQTLDASCNKHNNKEYTLLLSAAALFVTSAAGKRCCASQ